jgi:hypothetical protein
VKIVAPKVGGAKLADGSMLAADGQLAGTPSVLFDAVAVILSDEGAKALSKESAAIDFVRDAFGHLKAIAVDKGGQALLKTANVGQDAGVVDANDKTHLLPRPRPANGTGKSPFEHWHEKLRKNSYGERRRSAMRNKEEGKIGWILLWLVGIPIPILLVLYLLRGCT